MRPRRAQLPTWTAPAPGPQPGRQGRRPETVRICAALALALLLGGCAAVDHLERPAALLPLVSQYEAELLWRTPAPSSVDHRIEVRLQPTWAGSRLVASSGRHLFALDAASGRLEWAFAGDNDISGAPEAAGPRIFGLFGQQIVALDRSGALLWQTESRQDMRGRPRASRGQVALRDGRGGLLLLDAKDGREIESRGGEGNRRQQGLSLNQQGQSRPLFVGDKLLLGTDSGWVLALSRGDGSLLWRAPIAEADAEFTDVDSDLLRWKDSVFAAAVLGGLARIRIDDGEVLWRRDDIASSTALALDRGSGRELLIAVTDRGQVLALDPEGGETQWRQHGLTGRWPSNAAPTREGLALGDFRGHIHWLSSADGRFIARSPRYGQEQFREGIRSLMPGRGSNLYAQIATGEMLAVTLKSSLEAATP